MATPPTVAPVTKSTTVHNQGGSCFVDGLHIDKHGKVKISSPDFDCFVGFNPAGLLVGLPANPMQIKKGHHITVEVGGTKGTVNLTVTGGPCGNQEMATNSPHQIVIDGVQQTASKGGGSGQNSPNQIVID